MKLATLFLIVLTQVFPMAGARGQGVDSSKYLRLSTQFRGDGFVLDVVNDGHKNDEVWLARSADVSGQYWKLTPAGDGYFRLTTRWQGKGMSLDIVNDGQNVHPHLAETGNFGGQMWKLTEVAKGYYRLTTQFRGDSWSLDVINAGDKTRLTLAKTGDFSGQFWKLTRTDTPAE